ncbi:MAG: holin [Christensenellales bacterium]
MENVFTWKWLRAALVRALKTVAQTAAATIGTAVMISEVDWRMVVSAALLAGALSLLTSVAGLPEAQEK